MINLAKGYNMYNDWKDTSEKGFKAEKELTEIMNKHTDIKFENISEVNGPDIKITLPSGAVSYAEVKYYDAWYRQTSIETKCLDSYSRNTGWLFDDSVSRLFVMHSDFVYIYDANLLRKLYNADALKLYKTDVNQAKGRDAKSMQFIDVAAHSTLNSRYATKSDDVLRWDMSHLESSPLLKVLRTNYTDELEYTQGVIERREQKKLKALIAKLND